MPEAILLVRTTAGRQLVAGRCERAHRAGVQLDMTIAHARALLVGCEVIVRDHEPARDETALRALAHWAVRFSPLVAPDPPDGLLMDITGCERLYHGERRLLNAVANHLDRLDVRAHVAIASTFGCAWALARFCGRERALVEPGDEHDALAPLPAHALRLDESIIDGLLEVGLDRIGDLFAMPRLELVARFGSDLLLRMDQATGEAMETIDPVRPTEPVRVEYTFDGPVKQLEAILLCTRDLLDQLCDRLVRRECGARKLDVVFDRFDAPTIAHALTFSRASRSPRHLWSLLRPKIESLHLGYGLERIAMTVSQAGRLAHQQSEHAEGRWRSGLHDARSDAQLEQSYAELVDTLASRLGSQRIVCMTAVESHVPEDAFIRRPATEPAPTKTPGAEQVIAADRPSLLLARPERIEVISMMPEGPPLWFRWRGRDHRIVSSFGPERIGAEWWRDRGRLKHRTTRDYFKVQDEAGRWLWICRALETGGWFVHGEWA